MHIPAKLLSAEQIDTLADRHYDAMFSAAFDPIDEIEDEQCVCCGSSNNSCICGTGAMYN